MRTRTGRTKLGMNGVSGGLMTTLLGMQNSLKKTIKGGSETMETKSRYQVIAELEGKKRDLILERDSFDKTVKHKRKSIRELKREVEDEEEDLKEFEESIEIQKATKQELIKSIDESLKRFADSSSQKK